MKNINPFFLATGLVFLVCGYAWAGGSIEFLGNFSGGTVGAPVVMTGDNASGTGTVRIRPSDEDTQLVLCEASNNSSPEMCSSIHHINSTTSLSYGGLLSNAYFDSSTTLTRYNTAAGVGRVFTSAGTSAANNSAGLFVTGTGGSTAGDLTLAASGLTSATLLVGNVSTVTSDFRGPILNGGSATCSGTNAGSVCISDVAQITTATDALLYLQPGNVANAGGVVFANTTGTAMGSQAYYGGSHPNANFANQFVTYAVGVVQVHGRSDDANATTLVTRIRDNMNATAQSQIDVYGGGTVAFPQTQTVTCADNGGGTNATQTLDPQSTTITILNNDANGCDVTMQETSAILGARAVICVDPASTATNVNLADVANVFNGAAPALSQGDCISIRYFDAANDLWLQTGASNN